MKAIAVETEDKVNELLAVLDRDIEHIRQTLSRLDKLRSFVVKRDDASLGKLFEGIRAESDSYKNNELERQSIREELAVALGCNIKQMTLSRLEAELSGEKKAEVARRRSELRTLVEELKKEHLGTMMLLSDCARFNSLLLKSIFNFCNAGAVTYNSSGSTKRQTDTAFVNLQF